MTDKTAIKYIVLRALVFSGAFCFCFLAFFGNSALGSVSSGKSDSGNSALSGFSSGSVNSWFFRETSTAFYSDNSSSFRRIPRETYCFQTNALSEFVYARNKENLKFDFIYGKEKFTFSPDYSALSEEERKDRHCGDLDGQIWLICEIVSFGIGEETALDYVFTGFGAFLDGLSDRLSERAENASLSFALCNGKPLAVLKKSKTGRTVDRKELCHAVIMKLKSGVFSAKVPLVAVKPERTEEELSKETSVRGEFATVCNANNLNRAHNVRLALSALDGIKLEPEETLSFNGIVGERSERRGYKVSKVINNGEYAEGVGGGVCQVSTTVYNAALISGLEIVERHRHTLLSGYVEAGFDAMVSYGGADLKIKNNTGGNVYILTDMSGDGKIRVIFFGVKNPYEIKRESVLVADYGNGSVKTDSYLSYFREGRLLRRVRIHGDYYYPKRKP